MKSINIRLPDDLAKRLGTLADETGRTKSYYVRAALEEKLAELEDYFLALQSLEKVQTGKARVWSQDELEADRDLDD